LMDGVTRLDEVRYFREKIPTDEHVPVVNTQVKSEVADEFRRTYDAIDGERSIQELGRTTGLGEFATTRDVYALMRTNHVTLSAPRLSGGLTAIVAIANEALKNILELVDAEGKGSEVREG